MYPQDVDPFVIRERRGKGRSEGEGGRGKMSKREEYETDVCI